MWFRGIATNRIVAAFLAVQFLRVDLDRGYLYWQEELPRVLRLEFLRALRRRFPCLSRARPHHC